MRNRYIDKSGVREKTAGPQLERWKRQFAQEVANYLTTVGTTVTGSQLNGRHERCEARECQIARPRGRVSTPYDQPVRNPLVQYLLTPGHDLVEQ